MKVAMSVVYEGVRLEVPKGCDELLGSIMTRCWMKDPEDRPNFKGN